MHCHRLSRPKPDDEAIDEGHQPEQHVHQINPDSMLHADLAVLFGGRMVANVDLAEQPEECSPENT